MSVHSINGTFPILCQSPTYVASCNGKGEAKAAHPCFKHWGSTIRFLIRGLQNHLDSSVNLALTWHGPFGLPSTFWMPLSRKLKQEKHHQQEPQLVQCIQHVSQ